MPLKRTYRRKPRRTFRKRRSRKMVMYKRPRQQIFSFKRSVDASNWSLDATSQVFYKGFAFSLSDVPNVTEFTSLFDQYRILAVKVTFYPEFTQFQPPATTGWPASEFYSVIDYDDAGLPTSLDELNQFSTVKRQYFSRPITRYFKPQIICKGVLTSTSTNDGYFLVGRKRWLDMATPQISYLGLKCAISFNSGVARPASIVRVRYIYYFQCKNVR